MLKYFFLFSIVFVFTTCQKYPDGGLVDDTIINLFGKNIDLSSKQWTLNTYEVNGIDSTNLIMGANTIPNFRENFIKFYISNAKGRIYYADTYLYHNVIYFENGKETITIGSGQNDLNYKNDTLQCFVKNLVLTCERNILNPEKNKYCTWSIKKLTSSEFIIGMQLVNNYRIILNAK